MKTSKPKSAFTLPELLLVVFVLLLLVCTLLPALARTNQDSSAIRCLNNLRQLMTAWKMYSDDYQGILVANRSISDTATANWVLGWLDFSTSSDNTNVNYLVGAHALLGPYIRSPSYFKCPSDTSAIATSGRRVPRVRSISMNAWVGEGSQGWAGNFRQYQKTIEIVSPAPADLWVLIDENEYSINDGLFYTAPTSSPASDSIIDFPAARHNRACTISFADGRAELHAWQDPRTMPPPNPNLILNVPSANNLDIEWLNQHSTTPP